MAAVWDPDPAIAQKYAARFQCLAAADVASVLGMPDLDAVIVLSQTNRHEALVRQIAQANKHCFVEKPLGIGLADARNMMRALEAANVIFHMGYFNRTIPAHRLLKRLIAGGRVRRDQSHAAGIRLPGGDQRRVPVRLAVDDRPAPGRSRRVR